LIEQHLYNFLSLTTINLNSYKPKYGTQIGGEQTVSGVAFKFRISHKRTNPLCSPQAKRFDIMSPAQITIIRTRNIRAPLLRTFDESTMQFVSCIAKTLDRALGNKSVVANLKLEFSMRNLPHVSQSSSVCTESLHTSSSVQNGEVVEWAWYGTLEVFTVLTTRSEDKSQKCTLQSAAADINL
jgi:hypothetical protein